MGQFFGPDHYPALVKASTASVTLATTSMGRITRLTLGGQQYPVTTTLALSTAASGLGGIDTGSIAANTLYYVYAVVNTSGVVGLIASTSDSTTGPSGFSGRYKYLGKFRTFFGSTNIFDVVTQGYIQEDTEWAAFTPTGAFTNTVTYTGFWRRNKEDMECQFRVLFGAANTEGAAYFAIPTTLGTVNNAKMILGSTLRGNPVGTFELDDISSVSYAGVMIPHGPNQNTFYCILHISNNTTATSLNTVDTGVNRPTTIANGDSIYANVKVPIIEFAGLYS